MAQDIQAERYERVGWLRREWVPVPPKPIAMKDIGVDDMLVRTLVAGWQPMVDEAMAASIVKAWRAGVLVEVADWLNGIAWTIRPGRRRDACLSRLDLV